MDKDTHIRDVALLCCVSQIVNPEEPVNIVAIEADYEKAIAEAKLLLEDE